MLDAIHDDHRTEGENVNEASSPAPAQPDPVRRLGELAARFWATELEASPQSATLLGVHDHDDRIEQVSSAGELAHQRRLAALRAELETVDSSTLGPQDRVTVELLEHSIDQSIEWIDLRLTELASDHMTGVHASLLMSAPQMTFPEPANAEAALIRYEQVPQLLGEALDRFRAGLQAGRTPAAAVLARSLNTLESYLASPLEQDPFLAVGLPDAWQAEPQWRREATATVAERIRPAMAAYRDVLADELAPRARDDEHAGWSWLPDGEQLYDATVRAHTTTARSPVELHELGRELCEVRLAAEFRQVAADVMGSTDLGEIFAWLRTDPSLRHRDAQEVVELAERSVALAASALDGWFGRRPSSGCAVAEVPSFLAADAPYAYYYPPAIDRSRPGTYFVNTADPEGSSRTEAQSIAFHEAIPGHHLQIAIAQELDELPEFRRHDGATAYVEGWALYAERLADEMGLYSGPLDRLGMLTADAWRSARLVVDTGLHALGWSRQRAIDYLEQHTPVPLEQIAPEIDRYLAMPGQALSYKVGQLEIERLRRDAATALGEGFDLAAFHDVVLGSGAVTLGVLDRLVRDWLSSR